MSFTRRGQEQHSVRFEVLHGDGDLDGPPDDVVHPSSPGVLNFNGSNLVCSTLDGLVLTSTEAAALTPGVSHLRPVWEHEGTEWVMGVFRYFGGETKTVSGDERVFADQCPDRSYRLATKGSEAFGVDPGELLVDAFDTIASDGGIPETDGDDSTQVNGPVPLLWEPSQVARLDGLGIVTGLLGFLPPHMDRNGTLIRRLAPQPADEAPDLEFACDGTTCSIIADTESERTTVAHRPYAYVVRSTTPTGSAVYYRHEVDESEDHHASHTGDDVVEWITVDGLLDNDQAREVAMAKARQDNRRVVSLSALPDPRLDAFPIVALDGTNFLGVGRALPLSGREPMVLTLSSVYADA